LLYRNTAEGESYVPMYVVMYPVIGSPNFFIMFYRNYWGGAV